MIGASFEWEGMDELIEMVRRLPDLALEEAYPAMEQAMLFLHGQLPDYPERPGPDAPSPLRTVKQKRWFFKAVRAGQVQGWKWVTDENGKHGHPEGFYRRTGTLGRKFTTFVMPFTGGVMGILGTNTPYAAWVVGPGYPGEDINGMTMFQAQIHAGRWWQFYDVLNANIEQAWEIFDQELFTRLEAAWVQ